MNTPLSRTLGSFAVFFAFTLPGFAALSGAALYRPLVNLVGAKSGGTHWLANFYFNHFPVALAIPVAAGLLAGVFGILALRRKDADAVDTLGKLFVFQSLAAMVSLAWLAALILAAVLG